MVKNQKFCGHSSHRCLYKQNMLHRCQSSPFLSHFQKNNDNEMIFDKNHQLQCCDPSSWRMNQSLFKKPDLVLLLQLFLFSSWSAWIERLSKTWPNLTRKRFDIIGHWKMQINIKILFTIYKHIWVLLHKKLYTFFTCMQKEN